MSGATSCVRYFQAKGAVQNVMFRQTLMRGAQKRGLEAGASNAKHDRHMVELTLQCAAGNDPAELEEMVDFLRSGRQLNSWGARVEQLEELPHGRLISEHEVHTGNVDNFQWNSNVEMYL